MIALVFFVLADSVLVSWSPNSEPDLAGYRVYQGTAPRSYNLRHSVTDTALKVALTHNARNYFAVTAYDSSGNESDFSDEVRVLHGLLPARYRVEAWVKSMKTDAGWEIYGANGGDSGIKIINPDKARLAIKFTVQLFGSGECLNRERKIQVGGEEIFVSTEKRNHELLLPPDETIYVNYNDDCWIEGQSDANVRITNLVLQQLIIDDLSVRKGGSLWLKKL